MSQFVIGIKPVLRWTGIAIATMMMALPSEAVTLSFTTNRADLQANDQLNWESLGPIIPPQPFKVLPFSLTTPSQGGVNVKVNIPPTSDPTITPPLIFQTLPGGIETNFAAGDYILFTGLNPRVFPSPGNPGPLSLSFETPVGAAGAQIAVDDTFTFDANISAFDQDNNLLGRFSAPGTSSLELDNSALFLGARSRTNNISRIEFSSSISNRAIGINTLSLRTVPVPEPLSIGGTLVAGLGFILLNKRKSSQKH